MGISNIYSEYSATLQASVICRGYDGILLSARANREFEVAPRIKNLFVLDRERLSVRDFFY